MASAVPLQRDSLIQRAPNVSFESFDDEYLAIDGESGYCYNLNEVAWRVWELIDAPRGLGQVCDLVCRQYAVDSATCQADVTELAEQLRAFGLLRVVDPPG